MAWTSSVWLALFDTIGRGLDFVGGLFTRKSNAAPAESTNAAAARAGTAAGAAANDAGHIVEKKR